MGNKKNRKPKRRESWVNSDVEDEKLALQAIFGSDCEVDKDDPNRCSLQIVPHEAMLEENHISVTLHLTCVAILVLDVILNSIEFNLMGVTCYICSVFAGFQRNIPGFHFSSRWLHRTLSL
jgi:hypothetical protein